MTVTMPTAAPRASRTVDSVMARTVERRIHSQFRCVVSGVRDHGPRLRRITLQAEQFASFERSGPDEYFGLLMPPRRDGDPARRGPLVLPADLDVHARYAVAAMPTAERPELRWYTVAAHRPEAAEIDVDIVLHGDAGPGSAWARRVQVGDPVGFRSGGALYRPEIPGSPFAGRQLLVADETALPAMLAIRRHWTTTGVRPERYELHLEVESAADLRMGGLDLPADVRLHERAGRPGSVVLDRLRRDGTLEGVEYAWVCGESGLVTSLRRHLVTEVGMPRASVLFSGYWKLGAARG